jgi:hypothetical protein
MSIVADAALALEAALKTVAGLRLYRLGETVDPPGIVVGPPQLVWESYGAGPATATFAVFVMVAMDDKALERLWEYVTPVAEAVESVADAVVRSADPGVYAAGTTDLPCYTLQVEMSLS